MLVMILSIACQKVCSYNSSRHEIQCEMINMDCIGPLEPTTSTGKYYVLLVVDYTTQWPEAIALSSITAKVTCNAFLDRNTKGHSDCGSNFLHS